MKYLVVCTFELKGVAAAADYETAYEALGVIGLRPAAAGNGSPVDLPEHSVVGTYESTDAAFLRNCLGFKLKEVFARHGLEAEYLLVISHGELAWARGGFSPGDFASRHGSGALRELPGNPEGFASVA